MNHIYRSIWNASLGCWVAAPETAHIGVKVGSARITRNMASVCLKAALTPLALIFALAWPLSGLASSVAGASSFDAGVAGAGSFWSGAGMDGQGGFIPAFGGSWAYQSIDSGSMTGTALTGGLGGAGDAATASYVAGGGGGGGTGAMLINTNGVNTVSTLLTVKGGRGGNGGASISGTDTAAMGAGSGGGGGGGDGIGLVSTTNFSFTSHGDVVGGLGGSGGISSVDGGVAGGGGDGGNGIYALSAPGVTINNSGSITGGNGGSSIAGFASAFGALAGAGGAGVALGGAILNNGATGVIMGGNSGAAGSLAGFTTMNGAGGAGVTVTNGVLTNEGIIRGGDGQSGGAGVVMAGSGTLINAGSIQGGTLGGSSRADAVRMSGNNARLELRYGYSFQGSVRSTGTGNVVALGGAAGGSFDMTHWGVGFIGFSNLEKTGSGTWRLTGLTTERPNWAVKSGTLNFDDGAQLGDSASTIALGAARLAYTPTSGHATVNAAISLTTGATGVIDVGGNSVLDIIQGVRGSAATLKKEGSGTLSLNGPSNYGTLLAANGRVILNHDVLPQIIGSATDITIQTRGDLTHGGEFYGLDAQFGTMTKDGPGVLTLTGANYLAWHIATGGLVASSDRFQGDVDMATGSSFVLNATTDASYRNKMSGGGAFTKTGTATLKLTGASTYTGGTTVNAGTLVAANASALGNGAVTVNTGAALEVVSGTELVVDGNLTFNSGSSYRVSASPDGTGHSSIKVAGTANLNGSVLHVGNEVDALTDFQVGKKYTILSAFQIHGIFDAATSNFAYLDAKLDYSIANQVDLELKRKSSGGNNGGQMHFADLANTSNQGAAANALASLPSSHPLYQHIETLPAGTPAAVFSSLSGDTHSTVASSVNMLSAQAPNISQQHLRNNLTAGLRAGAPIAQSDGPLPASAFPSSKALPAWVEVVGHWQKMDGNSNTPGVKQNTTGLFLGADEEVGSSGWRVGGSVGYTSADAKVSSRDASADISSYSAAVYTGKGFSHGANRINVMGGLAYTKHSIESERSVATLNQNLKADYSAHTAQLFAEVGYAMGQYDKQGFEPFVGITLGEQRSDSFKESGGFAALSSQSSRDTLASTTLGVRAHSDFVLAGKDTRVRGTLGVRHAWGKLSQNRTMAFEGSSSFTVAGAPLARNTALVGLQAEMALSRYSALVLGYNGEYGSGSRDQSASVKVRWAF
ncbi:autotransporter domain-containing protein [Comamonas sp. CMM02]|uniref:autotransporter domain-containing protein n=1 Tax=Comamonas sp. CMM02 TaxID=2769307 RepID=UPI001780825D|nr:autotransporter domain-containing protein [Comamonas sp. CMM02]MBD9403371.1 autotransporter domain-containing protein [Comamonas sp. CMM02]